MFVLVNDKKIETNENIDVITLIKQLNLTEPSQAIAIKVNDNFVEPSFILANDDEVKIFSFNDDEGEKIFWHSSAHVLAQAVKRLWPEAIPTIGPAITKGFYYDFANLHISDDDFAKIEKEMKTIIKENNRPKKIEFENKQEAKAQFKDNPYKIELIKDLQGPISAYKQGEFIDLCRGPHLFNLGKIKAFKLLKIAGAYCRGDKEREMLTRIYAISFPNKEDLKKYLLFLEEARKRDHKLLGKNLDLFSFSQEAPGMYLLHTKGVIIWEALLSFLKGKLKEDNYLQISTPLIMRKELWETSGHWSHYKENMYTVDIDDREFALKPMNCPGCMLYYQSKSHSYREFPLRVAEIGLVHRFEPSGALNGLFRARAFYQDDAHIFMKEDHIKNEILKILSMADDIYMTFGLSYKLELSTRPLDTEKTIGTDEQWERTTSELKKALVEWGKPFSINEGDGAFYGPKIDIHICDALERFWQCGTIQLDMSLPEKFALEYMDHDGKHKRPIMLHRALFGSIERFLAILIEHFAGKFPLWCSPLPIRIICVSEKHVSYAKEIEKNFKNEDILCDIDSSNESVNKKIKIAQLLKINYMLIIGDKEKDDKTISIRTRNNQILNGFNLNKFISIIKKEMKNKSLISLFSLKEGQDENNNS